MKTIYKIILTLLVILSTQFCYGQADLEIYFNDGVQALQSGNYKRSVEIFSDVLKKASDKQLKRFCYLYRGYSYNGLADYANAIADFDKAIEMDPKDLSAYNDRGKTKIYAGNLPDARNDFLHVMVRDSIGEQGKAAIYYLARIAYQQQKFRESISLYDRLIILISDDPEIYFNRGVAKSMIMDVNGSIKDYDKAIELKHDYKEAYANRGAAKINTLTTKGVIQPTRDQTADACADLKKAKQLGDKTVDDLLIYCDK